MTGGYTADDFNGDGSFPLPTQSKVDTGWYSEPIIGIEGSWEVLSSSDSGKYPRAAIDRENQQYVISSYPRGRHSITEVNIAHSASFGPLLVIDMHQQKAEGWKSFDHSERFQVGEFDDVILYLDAIEYGDLDPEDTKTLISEGSDNWGDAIVFLRPEIEHLDKLVELVPFKDGSPTLEEAAETVIQELNLPRGKPKKGERVSKGDPEKTEQLQNKFGSYLEELEDES